MNEQRSTARILRLLKLRGAQNAEAIARHLKITAVAARQHLGGLANRGLIVFEDRREGVGRPKRFWSLSKAGHDYFPENHAGLTLELIAAVRAVFGQAGLDRVIRHREAQALKQYRALVGEGALKQKVRRLAAQRSAEGYMAHIQDLPDGGVMLLERHCPICAAASTCQGFCKSELTLFAEALGPDIEVKRTEHIVSGAERCAYEIRPKEA
ncbi:metalloregulator ArsR/SmtB family transcription factor [Dongia soli]|uniref:Metalloregulator ArsR/SmtB family transcription factor n=1 Tax=Dongia soli TaxID=600628 RepID=A0ABU5EJZ4_9PROT|nr:metalloregulator ArsR/SmtB family transcription factor [Dongia soli]MDY0885620.1 metalloregulator ArsR/SmtB family transcription factor [Dongia soli]